ncbi:hypothetical protein AB0J52_23290, partial [Spirillospora sp. NPDC049652]
RSTHAVAPRHTINPQPKIHLSRTPRSAGHGLGVCPSLPGYGFSDKPAAPGWGIERISDAWCELMARLGYRRFGAQGSDWCTKGGHFAAFEQPALFVNEVRSFFRLVR